MGNLSNLLTNPDSQVGVQTAIVTAVLLDEAAAAKPQPANVVLAGPASGPAATPAFRALVSADIPGGGGGGVSSVGLSMPDEFSVADSPVTTSGTLTVTKATQAKNLVYSGPAAGSDAAPAFRALVADDLPAGGISGSGTAGFVPLFSDAETLEDSPIDVGVTIPNLMFFNVSGVGGAPTGLTIVPGGESGFTVDGSGGDVITGSVDSEVNLVAGKGISINNIPSNGPYGSGISIVQDDSTGSIQIENSGSGRTLITDITSIDLVAPVVTFSALTTPATLYSAAGTPLPVASSVAPGTEATVSDATAPTYMGPYLSGGAVVCKVISDGATGWFTH